MEPRRLVDRLTDLFPNAKKQNLKRMVEAGRVRVNGRPARMLKQPVAEGDEVEVLDQAPVRHQDIASYHPLGVVFEDEDILVVDKPAGLLTSTVARERRTTAIGIIRKCLEAREPRARAGVIHRLDKDASGLLVFSKNREAFTFLKDVFFHHKATRLYMALVQGAPEAEAGRFKSMLIERKNGTVRSTKTGGRLAITEYKLVESKNGKSLLQVKLHTGRKHQIRVHLSERGVPIVGDTVYNPDSPADRLMLAATTLEVPHPRTGKPMKFEIPTPRQLLIALNAT